MHPSGRVPTVRARAAAVAMVTLAGMLPAVLWSHAVATNAPSASVAPATGLVDGQYVLLTMSGFDSTVHSVDFRQCVANPVSIDTDCTAVNTTVPGAIDSGGGGSTYLPVYAGADPALRNSGNSGSITCDVNHDCVVAVMPAPTDLSRAVLVRLGFAPSPEACPSQAIGALGGGSASAYRAIYGWQTAVCGPPRNLSVGYTANNSPAGRSNFLSGVTDFAVTGPSPPSTLPAGAPAFRYAPLTTSGVAIGYRIYDHRGPQVTTLTLTPALVARIFLGQIPNWTVNADVLALNPDVQFPSRILPYVRGENSSQTYVFSSWLSAAAPSVWTAGPQEIFPLPPSGVNGVTGDVGRTVVSPPQDGSTFFDEGNIGFMDTSTAAFYGLPLLKIKQPDGSVISATPDAIQKAIAAATVNPDGTLTTNYATTVPGAYPLPMPTYLTTPTGTVKADHGAVLSSFLRYAVTDGQSQMPPGYVPLPPKLVSESLAAAGAIPVAARAAAPAPAAPAPSPTPQPLTPSASPASTVPSLPLAGAPSGPLSRLVSGVLSAVLVPPPSPCAPSPPVPAAAATTPAVPPVPAPAVAAAGPVAPVASAAPLPCPHQSRASRAKAGSFGPASRLGEDLARLVLPVISLLCVISLVAGIAAQVIARRRAGKAEGPEWAPDSAGSGPRVGFPRTLLGFLGGVLHGQG